MKDTDREEPTPAWQITRRGATQIATLDRFPVRNALNFQCWEELDALLVDVESDSGTRALVLTGGEAVFSAGGDMKDPEPRGGGLMKEAARLKFLQSVLVRLSRLTVPTIAAVEGPAVGVGWGLALSCDFIVAGEGATFMAPFAKRGLVPDGAVVWHLVRAIGRLRATGILFSDGRMAATEAHRLGLVTEVTTTGGALARATAIAEAIASASRDTTLLTLRAIRRAEHTSHRDYLDAELELAALNLHGPDVTASRLSYKTAAATPGKGGR